MYNVKLTARAKRELKNISKRHKVAIASMVEELTDNPFVGKPMTRDLTGKFSLRVGVYRIIYTVNKTDEIIHVITAGHRSIVYN
ncbi:MAG: type II toxin-antitoxin system RelE/ParE family toxin [Candidatus Gottesmanbacteria bacterium]|nr:type II toxin-antitoxin system RelE/ParE family toxin [Candidatus Gottesmanbacteria bacterium]